MRFILQVPLPSFILGHLLYESSSRKVRLLWEKHVIIVLNGVSAVTATWNERENIKNLILSVKTVLKGFPHEIIVVDDDSTDGTIEVATRLADIAVIKKREGQTKGLLHGMRLAKYQIIITTDADMENSPERIPELASQIGQFDIAVASRTKIPRLSEKNRF